MSANGALRKRMLALEEQGQFKVFIPEFQYCTDNAGMIAVAAYQKFLKGKIDALDLAPQAKMSFMQL